MSYDVAAAHAATQPARAERRPAESATEHRTWPIAAIVFPSVVAAYAAVVGAIYLLATSVSWQLLAAGGLVILLFNLVLVFVLMLRTMDMERTRHARSMTAQRDS
jgi:fatty acid desaturase